MRMIRIFLRISFLTFTLIFLFFHPSLSAQNQTVKIDEFVKIYQNDAAFNGSVLVAKNGVVVLKKGYGLANRGSKVLNTSYTKFRIGSITKPFTAIVIMQLLEQKKIALNEYISTYLPYYRKDIGNRVTIHHLLTHTSGIPSYTSNQRLSEVSLDPYPVEDFIKDYCSDDLLFEPGTEYQYNNSGYFILGGIIEAITGKTYEEVIKEFVLEKAGMMNSGYDHPRLNIPDRATGYTVNSGKYEKGRDMNMSIPYAAGALFSTVEDFFLWDQAINNGKLLDSGTMDIMFEPQFKSCAYGWFCVNDTIPGTSEIETIISHSGAINGFNAIIERRVEEKILIVIFCNSPGANLGSMCTGINNILHGIPNNVRKFVDPYR